MTSFFWREESRGLRWWGGGVSLKVDGFSHLGEFSLWPTSQSLWCWGLTMLVDPGDQVPFLDLICSPSKTTLAMISDIPSPAQSWSICCSSACSLPVEPGRLKRLFLSFFDGLAGESVKSSIDWLGGSTVALEKPKKTVSDMHTHIVCIMHKDLAICMCLYPHVSPYNCLLMDLASFNKYWKLLVFCTEAFLECLESGVVDSIKMKE